MIVAALACALSFQGLTIPIPEHPPKKTTTKTAVKRPAAKPPRKNPPPKKTGGTIKVTSPPAKKGETTNPSPKRSQPAVTPAKKVETKPPAVKPPLEEPQAPIFKDEPAGSGTPVKAGETVVIHFHIVRRSGDEIADSKKRGLPYIVKIGAPGNDPLLDLVLTGMKPGGVRSTMIAAKTVYGPGGAPPIILPNDTLLVTVTLLRRGDK